MSGSCFICCLCETVLLVSSVIPTFFIQSRPSIGFVLLVVTKISNSSCFPSISTLAVVFLSNCIRLLFTSLYSVSSGCSGVILMNCDFDISVTGDLLSIMNLIGQLLTSAVTVKNSGPLLFIDRVEFCFTEWIVFGVQSSSPTLLVSSSIIWFTFLLARQHLANRPIFRHFAHFFPLTGHSCCLDQFVAPQRLQSTFLSFVGLPGSSFFGLVLRLFG